MTLLLVFLKELECVGSLYSKVYTAEQVGQLAGELADFLGAVC